MSRILNIPLPPPRHDQLAERPDRVPTTMENFSSYLLDGWGRLFNGRGRFERLVARIESLGTSYRCCSQDELEQQLRGLRQDLLEQGFTGAVVVRSFAVIRELSHRTLGMYHYPCQLMGGLALLHGRVAEMDTGEGKTLTATLAAATAALAAIPVHVVSVNDYLTARDAEIMGPLYRALGLTVGCVTHGLQPAEKRTQYGCDITYVTNKELAFDYLRDKLTLARRNSASLLRAESLHGNRQRSKRLLLRGLYFGIIDEADSILVDEARTPLIISGEGGLDEESEFLHEALEIAVLLEEKKDFQLDRQKRLLQLTEQGRKNIELLTADLGPPWEGLVRRESTVYRALQALHLFHRNENYIVRDGGVQIVDEFTGRVMEGRSWENGLHQMVEVKEGCELTGRRETLAKISYQRFFRRYLHLAGMTGTAREVTGELWSVYKLQTLKIPNNRPLKRTQKPGVVYHQEAEKLAAAVSRIVHLNKQGRPLLIGTRSVQSSEQLSQLLAKENIPHRVLNAKQDAEEAEIIKDAGIAGAVTIATNMAGRGTDIKLSDEARMLGGLHVLATERHEASRIDRQLAGRAGRQGDPGSCEVLISLEDTLFSGNQVRFLVHIGMLIPAPQAGWGAVLSRMLVKMAQRRLERYHDRVRKELFRQDQAQGSLLSFTGNLE